MARTKPASSRLRRVFNGLLFTTLVLGSCIAIRLVVGTPTAQAQRTSRPQSSPKAAAQRASQTQPLQRVAQAKPKVAAVVNGQQITYEQLAKECVRRYGEDVLESEVNKRLILAACAERGIKVTNREVEAEITRMSEKFGVARDQWLAMLEDERGITPQQYRRDIVWPTLALKRIAANSLKVTQEELQVAYESEFGSAVQVRLIAASHRSKAEKLRAVAMKDPKKFGQLAKDHSEDVNSAAARGMIPPIRKHVGNQEVERAAFAMKTGDISEVIPVANQFVILRCDGKLPPRQLGDEEKKTVMVRLQDKIEERKLRVEGQKIFAKLQEQAKVVNVLNDPQRRKEMPNVAAIVNGHKISMQQLAEQCSMRHGVEVLATEINRRLLNQELSRRSLKVQKSDISGEIQRAAETFGYFNPQGAPDVKSWLEQVAEESGATVDTYVRDVVWPSVALKKLVDSQVQISKEDMQKGFSANFGRRVEVLAIVMSDQRTAHEVFDLARKNPTEKFFGQLAHQYSVEPVSKANYGQVPPIRQHGGQPSLEREAFELKPGQMSGVVAVGDKFILLRCLGHTKPVVDDMQVVEEDLRRDIREKKIRVAMAKEFDRIKQKSRVENFLVQQATSNPAGNIQQVSHEQPATATRPSARRR